MRVFDPWLMSNSNKIIKNETVELTRILILWSRLRTMTCRVVILGEKFDFARDQEKERERKDNLRQTIILENLCLNNKHYIL